MLIRAMSALTVCYLSLQKESRCGHWPLHPGFFNVAEETDNTTPTYKRPFRGISSQWPVCVCIGDLGGAVRQRLLWPRTRRSTTPYERQVVGHCCRWPDNTPLAGMGPVGDRGSATSVYTPYWAESSRTQSVTREVVTPRIGRHCRWPRSPRPGRGQQPQVDRG